MTTKLYKTLLALKETQNYGIHSFELMRRAGSTRVAARVNDLKKLGHDITSKRETLNGVDGCRYYYRGLKEGVTMKNTKPIRYEFQGTTAVPIYN